MPFGVFAPLPLRLGGSDTSGITATQHARLCADLVAIKRAAPLCWLTYTLSAGVVTIHAYHGQNGSGTVYAPDSVTVLGTGQVQFKWTARSFEDSYEVSYPLAIRCGKIAGHGTVSIRGAVTVLANGFTITTRNSAGALADAKVTACLW